MLAPVPLPRAKVYNKCSQTGSVSAGVGGRGRVSGPEQRRQVQPVECADGGCGTGENQCPARLYAVDQFLPDGRWAPLRRSARVWFRKSPQGNIEFVEAAYRPVSDWPRATAVVGDYPRCKARLDGEGYRASRLARMPRAAIYRGRDQGGQTEVSE